MEHTRGEWLPHLTREIVEDARGPEFDAYLVALEGWRRGLELRWHVKDHEKFSEMKTWYVDKPGKLFSLSNGERTHYFFRTRGDKVTNEAVEIGGNKEKTKEVLLNAGVPVPEGKYFDESQANEEIIEYAKKFGFPVVVKPYDGSFGRGVVTNITDSEMLAEKLHYVREQLNYKQIIVERHITGKDYRLYVVGDKVAGAMWRKPANVVGNGKDTIQKLIEDKNFDRENNPRLVNCLIEIDDRMTQFIEQQGYKLDSILEEGKELFLTDLANISTGGDPINVSGQLPKEVEEIAVKAMQAVPGLTHGAVDVMVDHEKAPDKGTVVLELNPTSQIGGLMYPIEGKASDIPAAIIDYYFPETVHADTEKEKMYFDISDVLMPLHSRFCSYVTVKPMPIGKIYMKKYTVSGEVQDVGYHRGLRKQAFERSLNGVIINRSDGKIDIVVAGSDPAMVDDFEKGIYEDPERSTVEEVVVGEWNQPIKVGFEIKADLKMQLEKLIELKKEMNLVEHQLNQEIQRYKKYHRSLSWKATVPIRKLGQIVKKLK